jgi:hypothetical protein
VRRTCDRARLISVLGPMQLGTATAGALRIRARTIAQANRNSLQRRALCELLGLGADASVEDMMFCVDAALRRTLPGGWV